jgi:hypothetical protein
MHQNNYHKISLKFDKIFSTIFSLVILHQAISDSQIHTYQKNIKNVKKYLNGMQISLINFKIKFLCN